MIILSYREWSLLTGRGATKQEQEGQVKFYPYKKRGGGAGTVLAILKGGGGTRSFGVVLTRVLEILTIMEGGEAVKWFTLS